MKQQPLKPQVLAQIKSARELYQSGQREKALTLIQRVIAKNPRVGEAHNIAVAIHLAFAQHDRAMYHAEQSLLLDANNPYYQLAMGSVLTGQHKHEQSIAFYTKALHQSPELVEGLNGLAIAYKETGRSAESAALFDRLISLNPANADFLINRAMLSVDLGRSHEAVTLLDSASNRFNNHPILHDNLALISTYDDQITPEQAFEFHKRFGEVIRGHIRPRTSHPNDPDASRRIRIGYLSNNFYQHSNSSFLLPILEHHDHERFEVFLYSTNQYEDSITERIKAAADHWRPCRLSKLRETINTILHDKIDILVELSGHFANNSLPMLAAKPAPVQVTYLGYANTTGLDTIDYRVIDNTTDPSPHADELNTEKLIRLDGCFLTFEPYRDSPAPAEPSTDRPFTFGSFNNLKKLTESTVRAWSEILSRVENSRLLIKNKPMSFDETRDEVIRRFTDLDIDRSRIVAAGTTESISEHLAMYNEIDLALDTFPYTGTTTTCEALWMGVPVLTFEGNTHAHRVSASILRTIGREDLCTPNIEGFIQRAIELGNNGVLPRESREKLRLRVAESPLCDHAAFASKYEKACAAMWTDWCAANGATP